MNCGQLALFTAYAHAPSELELLREARSETAQRAGEHVQELKRAGTLQPQATGDDTASRLDKKQEEEEEEEEEERRGRSRRYWNTLPMSHHHGSAQRV